MHGKSGWKRRIKSGNKPAERDCITRNDAFNGLPIAQEFFLKPDTSDAWLRDPIGINGAYREYRHLRTHFGCSIICLESRTLLQDVTDPVASHPRWFLLPLEYHDLEKLNRPQLNPEQRQRFTEYAKHKAFVEIAAHHLYIVGLALQESAEILAS
jgi:hypothetical protein